MVQQVLQHLSESGTGIIRRSSGYFLSPGVDIKPGEAVSNLVGLVSGLNSGIVSIPKKFPRPLSQVIRQAFEIIIGAGGLIKIRNNDSEEYRILEGQERETFIQEIDGKRFTFTEDRTDGKILLVDVMS